MEQSQRIEYEILHLAVNATDTQGYGMTLPLLRQMMTQVFPDVENAAVVDACKRLFPKFLSLRKWDEASRGFRDYQGEHEDDEFFYRGDFRLKRTPFSRSNLEQLASLLPPSHPKKRPIGFNP